MSSVRGRDPGEHRPAAPGSPRAERIGLACPAHGSGDRTRRATTIAPGPTCSRAAGSGGRDLTWPRPGTETAATAAAPTTVAAVAAVAGTPRRPERGRQNADGDPEQPDHLPGRRADHGSQTGRDHPELGARLLSKQQHPGTGTEPTSGHAKVFPIVPTRTRDHGRMGCEPVARVVSQARHRAGSLTSMDGVDRALRAGTAFPLGPRRRSVPPLAVIAEPQQLDLAVVPARSHVAGDALVASGAAGLVRPLDRGGPAIGSAGRRLRAGVSRGRTYRGRVGRRCRWRRGSGRSGRGRGAP